VYNHRRLQQFHRNIYDPSLNPQDIQYDYHKNTWFDSSLVLVPYVLVASVLVASVESVESVESVVGVSQGVRS
jgi:hypothetical protein